MSSLFYFRLAASNMKKNAKVYVPYLLSCIAMVMMYYIMNSLNRNDGLDNMSGGNHMNIILTMGSWIIAIFSVIFLFYTNSFLLKRRKKEFGLFNILGMEKKHIFRVVFIETLYTAVISLIAGLFLGIILDKLMFLILLKILHFEVTLGFTVSYGSIISSLILFGVIFLLSWLNAVRQIYFSKPVELLKGGQTGEKEPKTRWIIAIIGVIALGTGYYISLTTQSPLSALNKFFVAVVLVIIGTYALFISGSIALLKLLRKNKKYYYQTKHFVSVSGMIYRMKQNAAGLANICILSTAVLVTLSTTVSLYIGREDVLKTRYVRDISVTAESISDNQIEDLKKFVQEAAGKQGSEHENELYYSYQDFTLMQDKNNFSAGEEKINSYVGMDNISTITVLTLSEYNRLTGENKTLDPEEVLLYSENNDISEKEINVCGKIFQIKEFLDSPISEDGMRPESVVKTYYLVVSGTEPIEMILKLAGEEQESGKALSYYYGFDLPGESQVHMDVYNGITNWVSERGLNAYVDGLEEARESFYSIYGGMFFIGIFLGLVFIMAAVLIIYYKQISEGYEDKIRFEIMQKVGISYREIKASIRSQILTVFFLPLAAAVIHIGFAFPVITRLLAIFNLRNSSLFAGCTAGTILVFTLFYVLIYILTARVYYKIVR